MAITRFQYHILLVIGLMGILSLGCGSSSQVQQQTLAATTDTVQTNPASTVDSSNEENQKSAALKQQYREQLKEDYQANANEITSFYILAQRNFYNGDYDTALYQINKALNVHKNADLLALKGSIYWALDDTQKFVENWKTALTMDKNVPLPLTKSIIDALQNQELLDENLEPTF